MCSIFEVQQLATLITSTKSNEIEQLTPNTRRLPLRIRCLTANECNSIVPFLNVGI